MKIANIGIPDSAIIELENSGISDIIQLLNSKKNILEKNKYLGQMTSSQVMENLDHYFWFLKQKLWDDNIFEMRYTLVEVCDLFLAKIERDVFNLRSQGFSLSEIGESESFQLTRERIRQIETKAFRKIFNIAIAEGRIIEGFKGYKWTLESFKIVFNDVSNPALVYYIFNRKFSMGKVVPLPIIMSANLEKKDRLKALRVYNYILYEGNPISFERDDFIKAICKRHAKNNIELTKLLEIFDEEHLKVGLARVFELKSFIGKADRTNFLIYANGYIRYYEIDSISVSSINYLNENIIEKIDSYYSTKYFFDNSREQMKFLGLFDEYELHVVLKALFAKTKKVVFSRMPIIMAPDITKEKFYYAYKEELINFGIDYVAEKISVKYGHKVDTLKGAFAAVFEIDDTQSNQEKADKSYNIEELKKMFPHFYYQKEMFESVLIKKGFIKPLEIFYIAKKLEFRFRNKYYVHQKFSSVANYFKHVISQEEVIGIDSLFFNFKINSRYTYIKKLLNKGQVFHKTQDQFYTLKGLKVMGVNIDDIKRVKELFFSNLSTDVFYSDAKILESEWFNRFEAVKRLRSAG